jgi:hypothetical protein
LHYFTGRQRHYFLLHTRVVRYFACVPGQKRGRALTGEMEKNAHIKSLIQTNKLSVRFGTARTGLSPLKRVFALFEQLMTLCVRSFCLIKAACSLAHIPEMSHLICAEPKLLPLCALVASWLLDSTECLCGILKSISPPQITPVCARYVVSKKCTLNHVSWA